MIYPRNSADLELRMTVFPQDRADIQQIVRFVGPELPSPPKSPGTAVAREASVSTAAPVPIQPPPQHDQLEEQVKQLREELGKQSSRADRLQEVVRILQNRIAVEAFRNSPPDRR